MKAEEILKIINKCSTLNENYQIKYVDPIDYSKLANMIEEAITVTPCCKSDSEQLFRFANYWNNEGWHNEYIVKSDIQRFLDKT